MVKVFGVFFFSSRRRHTRFDCDWSSDVCSSDLQAYLKRQTNVPLVTLEEARRRKFPVDWPSQGKPPKPAFSGLRVLTDFPLIEIIPFIDWSPFFHTWELRGTYPKILEDRVIGTRARE